MTRRLYPELDLPPGPIRARLVALRTLKDCGVIRASSSHEGFAILCYHDEAEGRFVSGRPGLADHHLTAKGRQAAASLKGPVT